MLQLYANIKIYITQLRFAHTSFPSGHPAYTISIYSPLVTSEPMYALRSALRDIHGGPVLNSAKGVTTLYALYIIHTEVGHAAERPV